jgi:hypothetical protein
MTAFITNWCPNPSFEVSLSGWSALGGTTLAQDSTNVASGQKALLVLTDGAAPAEGFYSTPVAVSGGPQPCSVSLSFYSAADGSITLSAVSGTTGTVFATVALSMSQGWQRAQVSGFTVPGGDSFGIMVQTTSAQALRFWADAAQMEIGVTTASPYIDGSQRGCSWLGTPGLSASQQPYQNATSASGGILMSGRATPVVVGEQFLTSASGSMTMSGDAAPASANPVAAFKDFGLFELGDPDPAMTYADQNNAGTSSGHTSYARNYGLFYPPRDYPVSGGQLLWKRAAYMAMGLKFGSAPNGQEQNISLAQVSLSPITGSAPVPAAYTPPRQLQTIIKPTRLNFCTNPAFAVSAAGWSGVATGTIAQDTTTATPQPGWLTVAQAGALPTYANSVAVSNDGTTGDANFDGSGYSYSAQALAEAGIIPGGTVVSGGITYTFAGAGAGAADNVQARGQTIPVPGPAGATAAGFLGASVGGGLSGVSGTVTVTYTDGTTDTGTLAFTDWTLAAGSGSVQFGNQVAVTIPYTNKQDGTTSTGSAFLFSQTVAVNPAKQVASITLPSAAGLHVFAVSLAEPTGLLAGTASGKVTVHASDDGASITISDLIVGDTYTASMYVQAGPGLADILAACSGGSVTLSALTEGIPYGGVPGVGYGQGPYGGIGGDEPPYGASNYGTGPYGGSVNDLPTGTWLRGSFTFVATASTVTLAVTAISGADVTYPAEFWVTGVLVEAGTTLGGYFDGSYGSADYLDYQWEGTAGLSRSYYYAQLAVKEHTVSQILAKHTPLGITYAPPQYLTPYTQ